MPTSDRQQTLPPRSETIWGNILFHLRQRSCGCWAANWYSESCPYFSHRHRAAYGWNGDRPFPRVGKVLDMRPQHEDGRWWD